MRRVFCFPACAVLPVLAACGRQVSDKLTISSDDAGDDAASGCPQPVSRCFVPGCNGRTTSIPATCSGTVWTCPDFSPPSCDDGGSACSGTAPQLYCNTGCGQYGWYTGWCAGGTWECPEFGAPFCPEDAGGYDACAYGSPISCPGPTSCGGFPSPTCSGGVWTCSDAGSCLEDAGPPPSFSCGDLACDPATSYCQIDTGGPVLPNGGVGSSYQCVPLPSSCDGLQASCTCVEAFQGVSAGCGCVENDGDVIFTCAVP